MRAKPIALSLALVVLVALTSCRSRSLDYPRTFELVWETLDRTYFDPAFGGLDWQAARDRYLPQIAAARTDEEFYRLVNNMLWELNVSHANLVPPGRLAHREPLACAEGSPGVDIRVLDGVAVVTSVKPGSPADRAGLRPGYAVHAVDGIPVEQIAQEAALVLRPPRNSRHQVALVTKDILGRVFGAPGTEVSITCSGPEGERRETRVARAKRNGRALGPGGILHLAVELESRRLDNGIGYIRTNTLQPPLAAQIAGAITSMGGGVTGVIFDLRGNSGGEIEGIPELFLKERTLLYLSRSRKGEAKVFSDPASGAFGGPLVLLIDQLTGSAGELLAGCLQAMGRAVVVGDRSPGAVTESDMTVLPNGAIFMYPVAQLATPDGLVLEGRGVAPDIEVRLERKLLLKGIDSQLNAAVGYLQRPTQK